MTEASVGPIEGYVVPVQIDGRLVVLWWGRDADGDDCVATAHAKALAWDDIASCGAFARDHGWTDETDQDLMVESESNAVNVDLVLAWLRGARSSPDPVAALNTWNLAADVSRSVGASYADRGDIAARCYDKLLAANVPYVFGLDQYVPRWTPREVRVLRRVLGDAVRVLRGCTVPG